MGKLSVLVEIADNKALVGGVKNEMFLMENFPSWFLNNDH